MDQLVEISRLLQNILRFGTVASVDHVARQCTVRTGLLVTKPMGWLVARAGDAVTQWAPSVGESVMVLCPGGDPARGRVLPALCSDETPLLPGSDTANVTRYPDGALIGYDPQSHQLNAALPDGGKANISASGGLQITGDTNITGKLRVSGDVNVDATLTATTDVMGGGKSLKGHDHMVVAVGSPTSPPR
jgi:phage baseplate assembly protein V